MRQKKSLFQKLETEKIEKKKDLKTKIEKNMKYIN